MPDQDQYRMQHPGEQHPVPPLEEQPEIAYPGATADLLSAPDHGEAERRQKAECEGQERPRKHAHVVLPLGGSRPPFARAEFHGSAPDRN